MSLVGIGVSVCVLVAIQFGIEFLSVVVGVVTNEVLPAELLIFSRPTVHDGDGVIVILTPIRGSNRRISPRID